MKIKINSHTIEGEEKDVLKIANHILNRKEHEDVKFSYDDKLPLESIRLTKDKVTL
ncbi:hypothetical protein MT409_01270 [Mammaliicoccus sciuri]|uniref:hypothetical protein n=1 Tax=Mammaliicoccus sciuri TaxID=1296 RepID=UPI001FB31A4A|nr:hypothetical protein [Mammaliicoccus sciuri]MCJ1757924.1 hypothetical protein [Mammaliicoccus sciuri]